MNIKQSYVWPLCRLHVCMKSVWGPKGIIGTVFACRCWIPSSTHSSSCNFMHFFTQISSILAHFYLNQHDEFLKVHIQAKQLNDDVFTCKGDIYTYIHKFPFTQSCNFIKCLCNLSFFGDFFFACINILVSKTMCSSLGIQWWYLQSHMHFPFM